MYGTVLVFLEGVPLTRALGASALVNLVSHPLFTFVLVSLAWHRLAPVPAVLAGESLVVAIEAALLFAWLRRDPPVLVAASLLANACSFAIGLLVL